MNYLAHAFLSVNNIDCQVGNLLADPLKGKVWRGATSMHILGMNLHGAIDTFTDANPHVSHSKSILRKRGYLKGVVIDVVYDHFLTKHWSTFSAVGFEEFLTAFNADAIDCSSKLPGNAAFFIERLAKYNILGSYGDMSGIETAFTRIDKRLSERVRKKESTLEYLSLVESNYPVIENDFLVFFPMLIQNFFDSIHAVKDAHNVMHHNVIVA